MNSRQCWQQRYRTRLTDHLTVFPIRHYKRDFPKSPHRHRVGIAANRHPVSLVNANTISYIDGVQEGKEMEMRVVVYNDGMKWHAQCLEKHVFASCTNIGDLPQLLALTIKIEIGNR